MDLFAYAMMAQTAIPTMALCEGEVISPMLRKAGWRTFGLLVILHLVGLYVMPDPVFMYLWSGATFPPILCLIIYKAEAAPTR